MRTPGKRSPSRDVSSFGFGDGAAQPLDRVEPIKRKDTRKGPRLLEFLHARGGRSERGSQRWIRVVPLRHARRRETRRDERRTGAGSARGEELSPPSLGVSRSDGAAFRGRVFGVRACAMRRLFPTGALWRESLCYALPGRPFRGATSGCSPARDTAPRPAHLPGVSRAGPASLSPPASGHNVNGRTYSHQKRARSPA